MAYDLDPITADCYPGTTVLINRLNIQDETLLSETETTLVSIQTVEWENAPLRNTFDFSHYKAIHKFLFGDLYEWAGQVRTVGISKKGTQFCPVDQIEKTAAAVFSRLKSMDYFRELSHNQYVDEIVDFYCVTNHLHPFREGNGRAQRVFLSQLIRYAGHTINFGELDGDLLMIATIQAAGGVTDQLRQVFMDAIQW